MADDIPQIVVRPTPEQQPAPEPQAATPEAPKQTILETYRGRHPEVADTSDYVLSRDLYRNPKALAHPNETYPEFATRIGVSQHPVETGLNSGLTSAALHLNEPIESVARGVGDMMEGGSFSGGYNRKSQELKDAREVGAHQNPYWNFAGDLAGDVADYMKFGPAVRAVGEVAIPALKSMGPMADAVVKMMGLSSVEEIPKALERAIQSGDDTGKAVLHFLTDVGKEGGMGAAAGAGGHVIGKGLSQLLGPLTSVIGQGLNAADDYVKTIPRNLLTKLINKSSDGAISETTAAQRALDIDKKFYDRILKSPDMNVDKNLDRLEKLALQPGGAERIITAGQKIGGPKSPFGAAGDKGAAFASVESELAGTGAPQDANKLLRESVEKLNQEDPSGRKSREFIGAIYAELIPQRLQGSFDPASAYGRNAISGKLNDKGQLLEPQLGWMGALARTIFERHGGGPGAASFPLGLAGLAGSSAVGVPLRGAGTVLDVAGRAATALGEPGTRFGDAVVRSADRSAASAAEVRKRAIDRLTEVLPDDAATSMRNISAAGKEAGATDTERAKAALADQWLKTTYPEVALGFNPVPPKLTPGQTTAQAIKDGIAKMPGAYQGLLYPALTGGHDIPQYLEPSKPEKRSELDVQKFADADPHEVVQHVAERISPEIAKQVADVGEAGYGAAMFSLMSQPNYRKALSAQPEEGLSDAA